MHRPAERYINSRNAIPESPLTPPPNGMAVMAAQLLAVEKDASWPNPIWQILTARFEAIESQLIPVIASAEDDLCMRQIGNGISQIADGQVTVTASGDHRP
jgi:hypothetical protein